MRTIITVLILGALAVGCSTVRERSFGDLLGCSTVSERSFVDLLRDTMIPEIIFTDLPREDAIEEIQAMWKRQTGSEMPAIEIREVPREGTFGSFGGSPGEYDPGQSRRAITFRARDISFYDAIRITGAVLDCDFYFRGVQEAGSPFPWVYIGYDGNTSMVWRLDALTKAGLDLGDKPDDKDITKALELRGVDCSKGYITIYVANNEDIWIAGGKERVALVKAIFVLSQKGYQVRRREESQHTSDGIRQPADGLPKPSR